MEPITLILAALAAGASAGALDELKDEAKKAVGAAYGKLRDLVSKRFREAGTPNAEGTLTDYERKPKVYEAGLEDKLKEAGADKDAALLAAAQALLDLVQQQGPKSGKYSVTITGSEGVMVGDNNIQTNKFGAKS